MSSDWVEELEPEDRTQWDEFVDHFRRDALSKIEGSGLFLSLVPREGFDVKFAVELGAAIMMDKPILAVVMPGTEISQHLRRVVDKIVEADLETEEGQDQIAIALREMVEGG